MNSVPNSKLDAAATKITNIDIAASCTAQVGVLVRLLCHGVSSGIVNQSEIEDVLMSIMQTNSKALTAISEV